MPEIVACMIVLSYFIPWLIAKKRHHPQSSSIAVLNLFLGWTGLGWIIALIWAYTAVREEMTTPRLVNG